MMLASIFRKVHDSTHIGEPAEALIDALKTNAADWQLGGGGHWLGNANLKIQIWISNEDYGLYVLTDGERWVPSGPERRAIYDAASELATAHGRGHARRMAQRLNARKR